ncbi:MAG: hypothetical protein Q7K55_05890 [Candidatus Levybacteria bacterium]|nr:hypothetical protein [Candidatus Levybacteria bacterium]
MSCEKGQDRKLPEDGKRYTRRDLLWVPVGLVNQQRQQTEEFIEEKREGGNTWLGQPISRRDAIAISVGVGAGIGTTTGGNIEGVKYLVEYAVRKASEAIERVKSISELPKEVALEVQGEKFTFARFDQNSAKNATNVVEKHLKDNGIKIESGLEVERNLGSITDTNIFKLAEKIGEKDETLKANRIAGLLGVKRLNNYFYSFIALSRKGFSQNDLLSVGFRLPEDENTFLNILGNNAIYDDIAYRGKLIHDASDLPKDIYTVIGVEGTVAIDDIYPPNKYPPYLMPVESPISHPIRIVRIDPNAHKIFYNDVDLGILTIPRG